MATIAPHLLPLGDMQRKGSVVEGDMFGIFPMAEGRATACGV